MAIAVLAFQGQRQHEDADSQSQTPKIQYDKCHFSLAFFASRALRASSRRRRRGTLSRS